MAEEQKIPMSSTDNTAPSSTVYLGNIPEDAQVSMIFDAIGRPGAIEGLRILPQKRCGFLDFVHKEDAKAFLSRRITLRGHPENPVLVSRQAKATISNLQVRRAISNGASRNIFFGGCNLSPDDLRAEVEATGAVIDTIKVIPERNIAFVHCASVAQAIHAVLELEQKQKHMRINYGDDRCAKLSSSNGSLKRSAERNEAEEGEVEGSSRKKPTDERHRRTVFLGGIPGDVTLEDLCDVIRGGALESVRILKDKNTAFISFLEATSAQSFHDHCNTRGFFIKGEPVKRIGWADIRIMSSSLSLALKSGATRVLYLGNLSTQAFSKERLQEVGSSFGVVESARLIRERNADHSSGYISFGEMKDAIYAFEKLSRSAEFKECKLGYARDRCDAEIPRSYPLGYSSFAPSSIFNSGPYPTPVVVNSGSFIPQSINQVHNSTESSSTVNTNDDFTEISEKTFNK